MVFTEGRDGSVAGANNDVSVTQCQGVHVVRWCSEL